jgi:hypothetical protein
MRTGASESCSRPTRRAADRALRAGVDEAAVTSHIVKRDYRRDLSKIGEDSRFFNPLCCPPQ